MLFFFIFFFFFFFQAEDGIRDAQESRGLGDVYKRQVQSRAILFNTECRRAGIKFVSAEVRGVFASAFSDFGAEFVTSDKDGEPVKEGMTSNISNTNPAVVTTVLLDTKVVGKKEPARHGLESGSVVEFRGAEGMTQLNSGHYEVTVIDASSFSINLDATEFPPYTGGASFTECKIATKIEFKPMATSIKDPEFLDTDLLKTCCVYPSQLLHLTSCAISEFADQHGGSLPEPWNLTHADEVLRSVIATNNALSAERDNLAEAAKPFQEAIEQCRDALKETSLDAWEGETEQERLEMQAECNAALEKAEAEGRPAIDAAQRAAQLVVDDLPAKSEVVKTAACVSSGSLPALCAVMGGYVAQEGLKALMHKFTPLKQWTYVGCEEVIPKFDASDPLERAQFIPTATDSCAAQLICLGRESCEQLAELKIFMVGSGAIGCELLKNLAMLGCCTGEGGLCTVTDPDIIEKSNLNRQFLFKEADVGHFKASSAGAAVTVMNPDFKVMTHSDKVCEETEDKFTHDFWSGLDCTLNALDNVHARLYTDQRSIAAARPLIDSGTTGTKGHVQVVLPHLTKSWGEMRDQKQDQVPVCIIHEFPSDINHTIQWAQEQLKAYFCEGDEGPQVCNDCVIEWFRNGDLSSYVNSNQVPLKVLKRILSYCTKRPTQFTDCIAKARIKFEKWYHYNIDKLLTSHPADKMEKYDLPDGTSAERSFWTLPRRLPTRIGFDPEDEMCQSFIYSMARLYAHMFKIECTMHDPAEAARFAAEVDVPPPQDSKEQQTEEQIIDALEELGDELGEALIVPEMLLNADEFEKDDDSNFHVAFITAASNLRARIYKIQEEDFFKTKLIAGKIIPAIATTTSVVSGLVCIELIKISLELDKDQYRDANVNLALPTMLFWEPDNPVVTKVGSWEFTSWDRLEVCKGPDVTLQHLLHHLSAHTGLVACDVYHNGNTLYKGSSMYKGLHGWKLDKRLCELTEVDPELVPHLDLRVIFKTIEGADLDLPEGRETPPVRVVFSHGGYRLFGSPVHPSVLPVLFLLHESKIDFELCPAREDMAVWFQDGDLEVHGTSSVLRYIANKHHLVQWYPLEPEPRAKCDMALEFAQIQLQPLREKLLLPHIDKQVTVSTAEEKTRLSKLAVEAAESLTGDRWSPISSGSTNMFVTGLTTPSIGDIAIAVPLILAEFLTSPSVVAEINPSLPSYLAAVHKFSKKWPSFMQLPETIYSGYHLRLRTPNAIEVLDLARETTFGQLLQLAVAASGIQTSDMAVRFGGSVPGRQPTNLIGYPDSPCLDEGSTLLDLGLGPHDIVLVSARADLDLANAPVSGAPPLLRTGSGQKLERMPTNQVQCPICYCFTPQHLIATHAERCELCVLPSPPRVQIAAGEDHEGAAPEEGGPEDEIDEPGTEHVLSRTYTSYMKKQIAEGKISQVVQIDMKKAGHVYLRDDDNQARNLTRISKDIDGLLSGLPLSRHGSIFVAQDKSKEHILKALIVGPVGSPYENGCFEFDIMIPPQYPDAPPLVQLRTTSRGAIRFNANLYANGKVCLSLLGTWSGPGWDKNVSTLLQVVESVQFNIMIGEPVSEHPWFNEPGYSDQDCPGHKVANMTSHGKACSEEYNRQIQRCTIKAAMIDMIKSPPMGFEEVVYNHFRAYADKIIAQVRRWEQQGMDDSPVRKIKDKLVKASGVEALTKVLAEAEGILSGLHTEKDEDAEAEAQIDPVKAEIEGIKDKIKAAEAAQEKALLHQAKTFRERIENLSSVLTGIPAGDAVNTDSMFTSPLKQPVAAVISGNENPEEKPAEVVEEMKADPEMVQTVQMVTGNTTSDAVIEKLLLYHPDKGNLETIINVVLDGVNEQYWLNKGNTSEPSLDSANLDHKIEEWICFCGQKHPTAEQRCQICQQDRKADSEISFRKATPDEVAKMLQDKLVPLQQAFDSAKHLLEICQGSGTVTPNISWEFQPAGYHFGGAQGNWSVFSEQMNDALEEAYIAMQGNSEAEARVEIELNGASYKADLKKMTLSSAGNEAYTSLLRRRDLSSWVGDLMGRAKVTTEEVQTLYEQLDAMLKETQESASAAEAQASLYQQELGLPGWPVCPLCTYVNPEDSMKCEMGCGYKPPHASAAKPALARCPSCDVTPDPTHPNYDPDSTTCFNCGYIMAQDGQWHCQACGTTSPNTTKSCPQCFHVNPTHPSALWVHGMESASFLQAEPDPYAGGWGGGGHGNQDAHSRVISTVNVQGPYIPGSVETGELVGELVGLLEDLKKGVRPARVDNDYMPPPHSGFEAHEVHSDEFDDY
eukprot:TRINITY_DN6036_c0_g1_i1.p1 TRINITY_DN6036_c0_g1~~TRINITY_DN6036_c0_g1_i1.p1  ORF type:complete len:2283 (-),score=620.28 TRINITY_DN6036_c0_g1_i1:314-7162(-)